MAMYYLFREDKPDRNGIYPIHMIESETVLEGIKKGKFKWENVGVVMCDMDKEEIIKGIAHELVKTLNDCRGALEKTAYALNLM